mgnify:CR=1 FL=1
MACRLTIWPLVVAATVSLALADVSSAQGSRLNIKSPPSRLNQRGPVPKVANPAAPLKVPPATPSTSGGASGHTPHSHRTYRYPYPYYDRYAVYYNGFPVYIDADSRYWSRYGYWDYRRKTYDGPLIVEQVRKYDPGVINEAPAPARPVDEGLEALREEKYRLAADIYGRRIADLKRAEAKEPAPSGLSDREEQRLLAVALIGTNRMDDALRHALEAYRHDATLRERPILGSSVIPSRAERADLVRKAVRFAQRKDAPESAWFLAAMLMEADNRPNDARRVLARAGFDFGAISPPAVERPARTEPEEPAAARTDEKGAPEP